MGKDFLTRHLFTNLKSDTNLTVPFLFGMMKVLKAHTELLHFLVLQFYTIFPTPS